MWVFRKWTTTGRTSFRLSSKRLGGVKMSFTSLPHRQLHLPHGPADFKSAPDGLETYVLKDGIKVIERIFSVPLDYSEPNAEKIRVYARNTIPLKKAETPEKQAELPYMVYLQGGPGFEVTMNAVRHLSDEIHDRGYQILWLDQRGTGLSTPVSADLLEAKTDDEKAEYLKHFRADNIVRDCEHIRNILLSDKENARERKWSLLGQSFGGFIALNYLSFSPEGLKEVFLTGGLAPIVEHPDPVYEKTIHRVAKRNAIYYGKYPQDISRVRNILSYLESAPVTLPNGGRLSVSRWLQLGIKFGMQGGIDEVHELVFRASNDLELFGKLSYKLLQTVQNESAFDGNPIYAILQEAIYCQGRASDWSAARVVARDQRFSWEHVKSLSDKESVYFSGEMVFPEMFDDYSGLRPLKNAAHILAKYDGWERLYDEEQLAKNEVKVTAASYFDDMYVDFDLAQETAMKVHGTEQFITNQLYHDGLRRHTKEVIGKLFGLSKREYN